VCGWAPWSYRVRFLLSLGTTVKRAVVNSRFLRVCGGAKTQALFVGDGIADAIWPGALLLTFRDGRVRRTRPVPSLSPRYITRLVTRDSRAVTGQAEQVIAGLVPPVPALAQRIIRLPLLGDDGLELPLGGLRPMCQKPSRSSTSLAARPSTAVPASGDSANPDPGPVSQSSRRSADQHRPDVGAELGVGQLAGCGGNSSPAWSTSRLTAAVSATSALTPPRVTMSVAEARVAELGRSAGVFPAPPFCAVSPVPWPRPGRAGRARRRDALALADVAAVGPGDGHGF
jgi:hypothetical protein